jgi:VWFA-related protein
MSWKSAISTFYPTPNRSWMGAIPAAGAGKIAILICGVALMLGSGRAAHGQVSPSMDSPNTPTRQPEQQQKKPKPGDEDNPIEMDQAPTLKVTTNIVNLFFTVFDKSGEPITSVTQGDCRVLEDGQPRPLKSFGLVRDQPLTLGVLLDTSGSQLRLLDMEKEAAKRFLKEVLRPDHDEAYVITFDIAVDLTSDYTSSLSHLDRALDKAEVNTGAGTGSFIPGIQKNKGTLLYDAVYLAGHDEFKQEAGRHAIVIITDGQDEGSQENLKSAIEAAQRADALVYVLLLYDPSAYGSFGYGGDSEMKKLTGATGGRVFVIGHDGRKLEKAFQELSDALHSQYVASFTPATVDGKYHALEVQCKGDGIKIDARKGYYAVAPQQ